MAGFDEELGFLDEVMRLFQRILRACALVSIEEVVRKLSASKRIPEQLSVIELFAEACHHAVRMVRHCHALVLQQRLGAMQHGLPRHRRCVRSVVLFQLELRLEDLMAVPAHDADPSFYQDWGDAREYTVGDLGEGECAGEVVSPVEFALTACEREVFEAQLKLEQNDASSASAMAWQSMLHGAEALLKHQRVAVPNHPDGVVASFRERFYDTQLFWDPFTGGKFAHYFFDAHQRAGSEYSLERAHYLIEEAQLFIEGCHTCYAKLLEANKQAAMVKA